MFGLNTGAGNLIRTDDILLTRQALFQLSYTGIKLAEGTGFEPVRPCRSDGLANC